MATWRGDLVTMREAAAKCDIHEDALWRLVYRKRVLPEPTHLDGKRYYYRPEEILALEEKVRQLRGSR